MRALPLVVAALLALAPVAGGVGPVLGPEAGSARPSGSGGGAAAAVGAPNASATNGSVHVLALPADARNRTEIDGADLDLGPAVGLAANGTSQRLESLAAFERVDAAETDAELLQRLRAELVEIEGATATLRAEQSRALAQFERSAIEPRAALLRLARIDRRARALESRRERIEAIAGRAENVTLGSARLAAAERRLELYTGPVRAHAARVVGGQAPPTRFYVSATESGVVLATVDGGEYLRETYRDDLRNTDQGRLDGEDALAVVADHYPVAWADRGETSAAGGEGVFRVRVAHDGSRLTAFVDGDTRRVFKEFQRRPLDELTGRETATGVRDGLRLTVTRTYPGGALRIELADAESGRPVAANITVGLADGRSNLVGTTGGDGVLWSLAPDRRFTVTAINRNSVTIVSTDPLARPRVHANRTAG